MPRVSRLTVIAVKGFRPRHPSEVTVTATGIRGDRQLFLVDEADKLFSCTRTGAFYSVDAGYDVDRDELTVDGDTAAIERGRPLVATFFGTRRVAAHEVLGPWSERFSGLAGRRVRLVVADEPNGGRDEYPLTLLGSASVAALGAPAVDIRRFRMSIEFAGAGPYAEDGWDEVRIGEVVLRLCGPVPRCAATNRHPELGHSDLKTLHLLKAARDRIEFGVYAEVVTPGTITTGDELHTR